MSGPDNIKLDVSATTPAINQPMWLQSNEIG
jgi:hypothetical protein